MTRLSTASYAASRSSSVTASAGVDGVELAGEVDECRVAPARTRSTMVRAASRASSSEERRSATQPSISIALHMPDRSTDDKKGYAVRSEGFGRHDQVAVVPVPLQEGEAEPVQERELEVAAGRVRVAAAAEPAGDEVADRRDRADREPAAGLTITSISVPSRSRMAAAVSEG